jgi:hypothetical protein
VVSAEEGAGVVDVADVTVDETEFEGLRDAVPAPLGVPAQAAVSVIIAARTTSRFILKTLV